MCVGRNGGALDIIKSSLNTHRPCPLEQLITNKTQVFTGFTSKYARTQHWLIIAL
jgi:hypothetical protein